MLVLDPHDLEQMAIDIYERHQLDPERPSPTATLARLELGPDAIDQEPLTHATGPARLYMHATGPRIALQRGLPRPYALHFVGHELGHHFLAGYHGTDLEALCDRLGAALGAPRPAVCRAVRVFGLDLVALAKLFRSTQTGAALRVGEVVQPVATISPTLVRTRDGGRSAFLWPDESTIRRWARGCAPPGLDAVPITDGRGRIALFPRED